MVGGVNEVKTLTYKDFEYCGCIEPLMRTIELVNVHLLRNGEPVITKMVHPH